MRDRAAISAATIALLAAVCVAGCGRTDAPAGPGEIAKGGGWLPSGRGVLVEKITLSEDGRSFTSTIKYTSLDRAGAPAEGGGDAVGKGARMGFE